MPGSLRQFGERQGADAVVETWIDHETTGIEQAATHEACTAA